MASKVAYVFPGQGSQAVGMGLDLYKNVPAAKRVFDDADSILGFSLSKICFEGPVTELTRTINTQPAIFVTSIACMRAAQEEGSGDGSPVFVAGHSLGEYTALVAASSLSFEEALKLVRERGRLMEEAGIQNPGGMAAILGMDESAVQEICREADVEIANINCPGQIAISGFKDKVANAMEIAKERGARRAVQLDVGGAFHSRLMQPASDGMAVAVADIKFKDATVPIVANCTATPIVSDQEIRDELLRQLLSPVRWQHSVEYMIQNGVNKFIELGSGNVLAGLIKRTNEDVEVVNLGDTASIRGGATG